MRFSSPSVVMTALALAGCSTTPLPEGAVGKSTFDIIHKIRCEARDAVRQSAVERMTRDSAPARVQAEGRRLASGEAKFLGYNYSRLDAVSVAYLDSYFKSVISMDFTFDIEESNDQSASFNFKGPIGLEVFSLGVVSKADLKRENTRVLRVADVFGDLAVKLDKCDMETKSAAVAYPIVGNIGLKERIDTLNALADADSIDPEEKGKTPVLTDTLQFTTTLSATLTPKLTINSPGSRLTDAGLTSVNSRTDQHKVVIAISLPEKTVVETVVSVPVAGSDKQTTSGKTLPPRTTRVVKTVRYSAAGARKNADEAIDRQYYREGNALLRDIKKRVDAQ